MRTTKHMNLSRFITAVALLNLSACGYIQTLFPDKERDYQFTTEIPTLVLPPDLNGSVIAAAPAPSKPETVDAEQSPVASTNEPAEAEPVAQRNLIQTELVKTEQGENRLRIAAPVAQAWRMVGKALSRKAVEVTQRNQEEKSYLVQYNPNEQKVEDESILDELRFMFDGFETGDKEYLIELQDVDAQVTEVLVTDKERQSSAGDGPGLNLLTLIRDTIKADVAGK